MRSGVQDQPDQHGETPSLLKIQKLAGYGGGHLSSQLLRRLRQENRLNPGGGGRSELRSCHYTPTWWQSEIPSQKKKKLRCEVLFQPSCYLLPRYFVLFIVLLFYMPHEFYAIKRFYSSAYQPFVSGETPFSISCWAGLVVTNSLNICLSGNDFIFSLFMKLSFATYKILG